jgi:DNA invertase Pin-like site-specific DNA recombinase
VISFAVHVLSTREQGDSGLSLDAQRAAIAAECDRKGWVLDRVYEDVASGKDANRPELAAAFAELAEAI